MDGKTRIRLVALVLVAASVLVVGFGYATGTESAFDEYLWSGDPADRSARVAPANGNVTVIATDSNTWRGLGVEGPRSRSEIVALDGNGSVLYYDADRHTRYWDVDPVPGTSRTVEYVYADHVEGSICATTNATQHGVDQATWERYEAAREVEGVCTRNGIDRVNLSTGEVTPVWSIITPGKDATRYHDADRINDTHRVVADIYFDRVFVVNVSSGRIVPIWNASDTFPTDSGGPYPTDWTHTNDVEVLPDGRIMASIRNHDQVVFVDPETGLDEAWTLGADDDHDVIYEQHNADFVPEEMGGPAVIVSDSENGRVQEFQWTGDGWNRTWVWSDARMQWPRDADRLPNGHTLITDSNGDRVFEVDDAGTIVWNVDVGFPYEAERLGTGDESEGGPSATHPEVAATASSGSFISDLRRVGGKPLNVALYVTPIWMGPVELLAGAVGVLTVLVVLAIEVAWLTRSRR